MFPQSSTRIAITCKGRETTYTGLVRRINACTTALDAMPGDRVAIIAENRPEWIHAFYAIWQKEAVAVPVDPGLAADDMALILKDSQPVAIYCSETSNERVNAALTAAGLTARLIRLETVADLPDGADTLALASPRDMKSLAALMYTSGTTGAPKGVMLSFENIDTTGSSVMACGYYGPEERVIALLPFFHILPLQGTIIIPFSNGCRVAFSPGLQKEDIAATLKEQKITLFIGVPRLYEMFHAGILEKVQASLIGRVLFRVSRLIGSRKLGHRLFSRVHNALGPDVTSWIIGGAKTDVAMLRDMWALGFRIIEGYGLTETAPIITFNRPNRVRLGTGGQPVQGAEVRIEDGEIVVRGSNVMLGYYNKPEATAKVIRDGWFHTGDTGETGRGGYLTITGRKDELIVLPNGKNIDPVEIERDLYELSPLIREVGVLQIDGQLAAVIYPAEELLALDLRLAFENLRENVIERYNRTAAAYRRILQLRIATERFPRTRMEKLRRYRLRDFFTDKNIAEEAPRTVTATDETTAKICSFLARRKKKPARPDSSLDYDLGLDSLDRLELISFVQAECGLPLTEADIAAARTVADVAAAARASKSPLAAIDPFEGPVEIPKLRTRKRSMMRVIIAFLMRRLFRLRLRGIENIPDRPCIVVANHESYLDAPALIGLLPKALIARSVTWVKESSVMERVVRLATRGRNMIVVHTRGDLGATLRSSVAILEAGYNLLVFPEGLRSRDGKLASFRPGFAMIAQRTGVPVIPVAIEGALEAMPYKKIMPRFGKKISLTVLEPIIPVAGESAESLATRCRDAIAALVEHPGHG